MSEFVILGRHQASLGLVLKVENRLLEPHVPFQGCVGVLDVDLIVQVGEIAVSASGEVDELSHAALLSP